MAMHFSLMLGHGLADDRRSTIAAEVRRARRPARRPRPRPRNPVPDAARDPV